MDTIKFLKFVTLYFSIDICICAANYSLFKSTNFYQNPKSIIPAPGFQTYFANNTTTSWQELKQIITDNDDKTTRNNTQKPHLSTSEQYFQPVIDYIDVNRSLSYPNSPQIGAIIVEMWIIVDYQKSLDFAHNRFDILDYVSVFFNGVNSRYSNLQDVAISFVITGLTVISSQEDEPFMSSSFVRGYFDGVENKRAFNGYDSVAILNELGPWVWANRKTVAPFDAVMLITGRNLIIQDHHNEPGVDNYRKSSGLAYLASACQHFSNNEGRGFYYGILVVEDKGKHYEGLKTATHELGHVLGATHDGEGPLSSSCSPREGYTMSFQGQGTLNKFYFSPCSHSMITAFVRSNEASCLYQTSGGRDIKTTQDLPGDRISMEETCARILNESTAIPDISISPDILCRNLTCYSAQKYFYFSTNYFSPEHAPCGNNGGKCSAGYCRTNNGTFVDLAEEEHKEDVSSSIVTCEVWVLGKRGNGQCKSKTNCPHPHQSESAFCGVNQVCCGDPQYF